jgi:ribosomal protein S18
MYLAGYESGHYQVEMNPPDQSLGVTLRRARLAQQAPAGVWGGFGLVQPGLARPLLVPFKPDLGSPANQVAATVHRFGREMPVGQPKEIKNFVEFAKAFIPMAWPSTLEKGDVPECDEWLAHSNYPGSRRDYLLKMRQELRAWEKGLGTVKSFIKDECYSEPKQPRAINSFDDTTKVILGPLFHAIDQRTFGIDEFSKLNPAANPGSRFFVKGTNPRDWPKKLGELFGTKPVLSTDFSSFEAHHRDEFAYVVYFWMLHMIRKIPECRPLKTLIAKMVTGRHSVEFKHIKCSLDYRLMSGALWTSSSNGVLNLLLMSYLSTCHLGLDPRAQAEHAVHSFIGKVEGDDGICDATHLSREKVREFGERMGLVLKPKVYPSYSGAGFCGIVCDAQAGVVCKDPIEVMRKFFVLPSRYANARQSKFASLYRARALSYLANFGACPVIGEMCHWVCRMTAGADVAFGRGALDQYHQAHLDLAMKERVWTLRHEVSDTSRVLVQDHFGLCVEEQRRMEAVFRNATTRFLEIDLLHYCSLDTISHALTFVYDKTWVKPPHELPPVVANILAEGLKPTKVDGRCESLNRALVRCRPHVEPLVSASYPSC